MMGKQEEGQEGIIPHICKDLFRKIKEAHNEDTLYSVEVRFALSIFYLKLKYCFKKCRLILYF